MAFELIQFAAKAITSDIKALWEYCKEQYEDNDGGKIVLALAVIAAVIGLVIAFSFPRTVLVGVFIAWRLYARDDEDHTDDE